VQASLWPSVKNLFSRRLVTIIRTFFFQLLSEPYIYFHARALGRTVDDCLESRALMTMTKGGPVVLTRNITEYISSIFNCI